jgi:putative oxidoreductase
MSSAVLALTAAQDSNDGFNAAVLLLRVVVGLTLSAHGYNKFFGGGKIPGTARWFDSMGMKPNGKIHALFAATTELGGGLLLALGLLTPFAGAAFVGLMIVAAYTVHLRNGFFIVKEGVEYNLVLATIGVAVATMGPGRYSLDQVINFNWAFHPKIGLGISLGLGVVAAGALLACCYRPPKAVSEPEPDVSAESDPGASS